MYAIIENEVVTNIVVWDGKADWQPEEGKAVKIPKDQVVSIGDLYQDGKWIRVELDILQIKPDDEEGSSLEV